MTTRYNSNYVNPTFKSDIFNLSSDSSNIRASSRDHKVDLNASWSHDNLNSRSNRRRASERDDDRISSNSRNTKQASLQNSRPTGRQHSVKQQIDHKRPKIEDRAHSETHSEYSSASTRRMSAATNADIQAALFEREQIIREQSNYKRELDKQVQEKKRNEQIKQIVDFNCLNTGLPIGEIHGGFDVQEYARILRVKENKKYVKNTRERSREDSDHECSFDDSVDNSRSARSCSARHYGTNPASFLHDRKVVDPTYFDVVDEESDTESQDGFGHRGQTWSALQKKKAQRNNPDQYVQPQSDSKYHVQKICQQKLKEHLKSQVKKYEDYTARLIEDQKKRKENWMQNLKGQMEREAQRKKVTYLRNEQQNGNLAESKSSSSYKSNGAVSQLNQSLLTQMAEKFRSNKDQNQDRTRPAKKTEGREGRCQRLLEDTVKQLLSKRASQK